MTATNVQPLMKPDPEQMRQHLEHLFGGDLGGCHDGLIEIAWTSSRINPETGKHDLSHARLFGTDEIDEAIEEARRQNSIPNQNVYVGAALRKPTSSGRCYDANFLAMPAYYVDLDDPEAANRARVTYRHCPPTLVVVTGRHPYIRAQCWWRLDEPDTDPVRARAQNAGLAAALNGDASVRNVGRVMRLAGSIAWPLKPGRTLERTELIIPSGQQRTAYVTGEVASGYDPIPEERAQAQLDAASYTTAASDSLGIQERIVDGRERYMRNSVLACLIEYIGENGATPTTQELFDAAWPQYSAKVDFGRPGRGVDEMRAKCVAAINRFSQGRIRGARTLEEAIESYRSKNYFRPQPEAITQNNLPLPLIWFREIEGTDEIADFVEGMLCETAMSVVYGESNCGKTFFMTDLSLHVAMGQPWRDLEIERGAVIYVALEGGFGIKNRVLAFKRHHKLQDADIPFAIVPCAINMLDPEADTPRLITLVAEASKALDVPVRLIVIDTLARAMAGGNENAADDMGAIVMNADKIRQATSAHLCFVHHSGKDQAKGARGHSSLRAATDTEIEITRDVDAGISVARVTKQRDLEIAGEFAFKLDAIELGRNRRNKAITSCIVSPTEAVTRRAVKLTTSEFKAKKVLWDATATLGKRPTDSSLPNIPMVTLDQWKAELAKQGVIDPVGTDASRAAFSRLRRTLVEKGVIVVHNNLTWVST